MAEVTPVPPTASSDAMQDVSDAQEETTATQSAPEEPEIVSETLYIQNLNEKIKIDGIYPPLRPDLTKSN